MNRKLSKWHFWTFFIFFNCTFFPLFLVGLLGQPRRVFEYASNLQTLNDISSISAYFLGASFFFFIINFVWSVYLTPHEAPAEPVELARPGVADTHAGALVQLRAHSRRARTTRTTTASRTPHRWPIWGWRCRRSPRRGRSTTRNSATGVDGDGDPRPPIL